MLGHAAGKYIQAFITLHSFNHSCDYTSRYSVSFQSSSGDDVSKNNSERIITGLFTLFQVNLPVFRNETWG